MRNTISGFYKPIFDVIYADLDEKHLLENNGVAYAIGMKLENMLDLCTKIDKKLKRAITVNVKNQTHEYMFDEESGMVSDLVTEEQLDRLIENFDD